MKKRILHDQNMNNMFFRDELVVHAQDFDKTTVDYFRAHRKMFGIMQDTDFIDRAMQAQNDMLGLLDAMEKYSPTLFGTDDAQQRQNIAREYDHAVLSIVHQHGFDSLYALHEAFVMCMLHTFYEMAGLDPDQTVHEMLDKIINGVTGFRPRHYAHPPPAFTQGTDMVRYFCDYFTWLDICVSLPFELYGRLCVNRL